MTLVYKAARIEGLSGDTKPTNVQTNRQFFETDTGLTFNFNGSTWDQVGGGMTVDTSTGTYNHPNATTEATVLELTDNSLDTTVSYDVSLLTQTTTIRVKEKMDGTTYEIQSERAWPTDFDPNVEAVVINLLGKGRDQIITFQSNVLEGSIKAIPWSRRDVS